MTVLGYLLDLRRYLGRHRGGGSAATLVIGWNKDPANRGNDPLSSLLLRCLSAHAQKNMHSSMLVN